MSQVDLVFSRVQFFMHGMHLPFGQAVSLDPSEDGIRLADRNPGQVYSPFLKGMVESTKISNVRAVMSTGMDVSALIFKKQQIAVKKKASLYLKGDRLRSCPLRILSIPAAAMRFPIRKDECWKAPGSLMPT